jgi:RNA polymerase sigma-70 factor (sigma-E family)
MAPPVLTRTGRRTSVTSVEPPPGTADPSRWSADDALTELYRAHWAALVRLSYLLVRDQAVAEEVVQDAFVAMHRRWAHLDDHDHALSYLRTSVVNGSRSSLRRRGVRERWAAAGGPTRLDPAPRGEGTQPSAEDVLVDGEERRVVNDVLRALPARQREVLVLRYHLSLSELEIAATLDISPGAVKSHAHRGLAAMRRALAPTAPDEEPR